MKRDKRHLEDELRAEYDFSKLRIRRIGPERKQVGDMVRLEPDVAEVFPDAASVNEALRLLIRANRDGEPAR